MKDRVTGIGGVFFKSGDPAALAVWYRKHLGLDVQPWGGVVFSWSEGKPGVAAGCTVWSPFQDDTKYFEPSAKPWMINYRVAELDRLLDVLRGEGVQVLTRYEVTDQGKFGYVLDPEGNLLELWEPAPEGESPSP